MNGQGMGIMGALTGLLLAAVTSGAEPPAAPPAPAAEHSQPAEAESAQLAATPRFDDTGRFYLFFQTGLTFILNDKFAPNTHYADPDGLNPPIAIGFGYNISKHFSLEMQGFGTEPDVRSNTLGKLAEYSNISVFGSVRYRYPIGDGRLVPWVLGGIGWSLNDLNDTTNPRIKLKGDGSTIAGTLGLGFDYFLVDDVAVGASMQSMIYPSIDTQVIHTNTGATQYGSTSLTSISILAHIRIYPGQAASADGGGRRLFLADHGPFDSNERRYYLFATAGDQIIFDDSFGAGVKAQAPGGVNWALGGGAGVNFDGHWGFEIALLNSEVNLTEGALGKIVEMSNFTVLPTVRYRWQFFQGRLVPFATAGFGVTFNNPNDPRNYVDVYQVGGVRTPKVDLTRTSIAASAGAGVEYYLNRHISVALALPVMIFPDWNTSVQRRSSNGANVGQPIRSTWNYTGIFPNIRLTAYIP
jgi:Outer membrane protein beta-barrel domain